jgi:hypothetical protein
MAGNQYAVILVYSTSHALRVEKILQRAGITCKLIPVPRHLSSDCGACIRIQQSDAEAAGRVLEAQRLEIGGIHSI